MEDFDTRYADRFANYTEKEMVELAKEILGNPVYDEVQGYIFSDEYIKDDKGLARAIDDFEKEYKYSQPTHSEVREFAIGGSRESMDYMMEMTFLQHLDECKKRFYDNAVYGKSSYKQLVKDVEFIYKMEGQAGVYELAQSVVSQKPGRLIFWSDETFNEKFSGRKYTKEEFVREATSAIFTLSSVIKDIGIDPKDFEFVLSKQTEDGKVNDYYSLDDITSEFSRRYGNYKTNDLSGLYFSDTLVHSVNTHAGKVTLPQTTVEDNNMFVYYKKTNDVKPVEFVNAHSNVDVK